MFVRGQLTRQRGVDPRALTFAVLDLQTTGLHPRQGSRVCEVGIVRMRGDGVVLDEYSTLVNPCLRISNDEFHGITNADVQHAPRFQDIAGDVLAYLSDSVVVGHNLDFEEKFLVAEFGRSNVTLAQVPGVCSLVTSRVQLDRWGYKLENIANLITDEWPAALHSALGNARALAEMLARLIAEAPQPLYWLGPPPAPLPQLPRSGIIAPRAVGLRKGTEGWLATLTARLPRMAYSPQPRPDGLRDYRALLAHALADGRIVGEEANQLAVLAARAGLTQATARQVHEEFLAGARDRAEADGVVTSAELRELQRAAKELAASHLISDLEEAASANRARSNGPLKSWRIMPIGDSAAVTEVVDFAVEHGAKVAVNLTKTVRLVICDRAAENDPRIAKALAAGVDVVSPDQARKRLESEVATVPGGLFTDPRGEQVANRLAAEQAAATPPARPEWHEFWRPRELTPAEYHAMFVERHEDWDEIHTMRITVPVAHNRQPAMPTAAKKGGCAAVIAVGGAIVVGVAELVRQVVA
ncbi:DNA polymerase III subunit epsilon [Micromonospora sp. S4605]|uniref:exonuclease domain-containing protein n=1 Tax=Micromonospora sp. S4605 TaxID=1420897 RepID=UPI000D6EC94C|nr:exonuclease domain-containing protein [Micromonospora sp. S4605]PWU51824.1 DNA polymerase III subunit epsilon [Micromonospora sp. S4605]